MAYQGRLGTIAECFPDLIAWVQMDSGELRSLPVTALEHVEEPHDQHDRLDPDRLGGSAAPGRGPDDQSAPDEPGRME